VRLFKSLCSLSLVASFIASVEVGVGAQTPGVTDVSSSAGGVYVATLPSGADVWIDGLYVGRSPLLVDALFAGRHTVTLTRAGWNVSDLELNVSAGSVTFETIGLTKSPKIRLGNRGTLTIRGTPQGAALMVDGVPLRGDPAVPTPLDAGPHHLTITAEGASVDRRFTVYPDTTTIVLGREQVQDPVRSTVVAPADTYLPDGTYSVDGNRIGITYRGRHVSGRLGESTFRVDGVEMTYDVAPLVINKRLYLPLRLLIELTKEDTPPVRRTPNF
jgi:hypothetical protein